MVAAAKLRRAQEAATAARPYAERMDRVLANLGSASPSRAGASPLLVGTGKDDVHLLIVMTGRARPVRRLQLQHRRLARADAQRLLRRRQDGQDPDASAARATTSCAASSAGRSSTASTCKGVKQVGFANADDIAAQGAGAVRGRRVRRRHALLLRVQVGDRAEADRAAADPGQAARAARAANGAPSPRRSTSTSPTRRRSWATCCRATSPTQIFRGLLENAASEQGARMSAMDSATRNAGEMIDKLTLRYNRPRQANDHQGADRDHLRRRGAVGRIMYGRGRARPAAEDKTRKQETEQWQPT